MPNRIGDFLFSALSGAGQDIDRKREQMRQEAQKAGYFRKLVAMENPELKDIAQTWDLPTVQAAHDAFTLERQRKQEDLHNKLVTEQLNTAMAAETRRKAAETEMPQYWAELGRRFDEANATPEAPPPIDVPAMPTVGPGFPAMQIQEPAPVVTPEERSTRFMKAMFGARQLFPHAGEAAERDPILAAAMHENFNRARTSAELGPPTTWEDPKTHKVYVYRGGTMLEAGINPKQMAAQKPPEIYGNLYYDGKRWVHINTDKGFPPGTTLQQDPTGVIYAITPAPNSKMFVVRGSTDPMQQYVRERLGGGTATRTNAGPPSASAGNVPPPPPPPVETETTPPAKSGLFDRFKASPFFRPLEKRPMSIGPTP